MPLKIDLKPSEKFVLNGAVVQVGRDGRSLVLQNDAILLRDRDVMQEGDATTPVRRIYFQVMLMYIDPENRSSHERAYQRYVDELAGVVTLPELRQGLIRVVQDVSAGAHYRALKTARRMMAVEAELLKIAPVPGELEQAEPTED